MNISTDGLNLDRAKSDRFFDQLRIRNADFSKLQSVHAMHIIDCAKFKAPDVNDWSFSAITALLHHPLTTLFREILVIHGKE